MTKTSLLCGLLVLTGGCLAGAENLSVPIAGFVADPSRQVLRAIAGVPGSYLFSQPLPLPDGVTRIHIAGARDYALAQLGEAGLGILSFNGAAIDRLTAFPAALHRPDWIVFSRTAGTAVLYSAALQRLQLLTGLPDAPQVGLDVDTATLPEQPRTAAASDDGRLVLVGSGHSVYRLARDGAPQLVLSAEEVVSIAILNNGADAAVSERSTDSIHIVHNAATAPESRVLVSGLTGIGRIHPSSDGRSLFVVRPGAGAVSWVDLASGEAQTLLAPAVSRELLPLRDRDTFLISARPGQPGSVFFRDGNAGRVVFIPAVQEEAK